MKTSPTRAAAAGTTDTSSSSSSSSPGSATASSARDGLPQALLRAEGLVALAAACWAYATLGGSWWLFAALFLAPDVSMLGYLVDRRLGAWCYNAAHTLLAPAILVGVAMLAGWGPLDASGGILEIALIWVAHVAFDRAVGYGLKHTAGFHVTHLSARRRG